MNKHWYQKQLRMVQTVLRETDVVNYDAKDVLRYLKDAHSNCVIINAGGVVDYCHSGIPGENPNPYLQEDQDIIADLVRECHAENIRVIARVDFRGSEKYIYDAHPDWYACDEEGNPHLAMHVNKNSSSPALQDREACEIYAPCYNSYYMNEHAQEYLRFLFNKYDIDGIWENAVTSVHGVCYCARCREKYLKDNGYPLPHSNEMNGTALDEYKAWKYKCATEHLSLVRHTIKEFGEEKSLAAEIFGFYHPWPEEALCACDLRQGKAAFDFFVTLAFASTNDPNTYPTGIIYPASIAKYMKMLSPEKQAVIMFGNNGGQFRYVRDPETEQKIELWEAVSAGANFWNCHQNAQHPAKAHDNRTAFISNPVFEFLEENKGILEENYPIAEVGIYKSMATEAKFASTKDEKDSVLCSQKGAEKILSEKHIQFVHLPDFDIGSEDLKRIKAIILTNAACLSDREIDLFKKYVADGGNIISTFETSLYDEKGKKRADFGLGEVFGIRSTGLVQKTSFDCYQMIRDKNSPLLKDLGDTDMLANCTFTHLSYPLPGAEVATTYVPLISFRPPDKSYVKIMETDYPVAVVNRYGKGRSVYFANLIDKGCYKNAHDDIYDLYSNAIDLVLNESPMMTTNAPASVHIQAIKVHGSDNEVMLSLVNSTGTPYRPLHELVPVHDIKISFRYPGEALKESRVLRAEYKVSITQANSSNGNVTVELNVDRLDEFLSVYLAFCQ